MQEISRYKRIFHKQNLNKKKEIDKFFYLIQHQDQVRDLRF